MIKKITVKENKFFAIFSVLLSFFTLSASAEDWPMWRYDASRSAATEHSLEPELHLQWTRVFSPPARAWPPQLEDGDKLEFDLSHQAIVHDGLVFVTQASNDSIVALDLESGELKWRFYGEGPFRLAPAAWNGYVYAGSDDGHLYCIDARSGEKLWKFRGGPPDRRVVLGNERLISMWPARGGALVKDGTVYFGAGMFPFMGTFLYALDAETGDLLWENTSSASEFLPQVHQGAGNFSGVVPHGYLAADDAGRLLAACGRARPGVFLRETGEFMHMNISARPAGSEKIWRGGPIYGGYNVFAGDDVFFLHGEMLRTEDGGHVDWVSAHAFTVLDRAEGVVYGTSGGRVVCYAERGDKRQETDRKETPRTVYDSRLLWDAPAPDGLQRLHIKAGDNLYGSGGGGRVMALHVDAESGTLEKTWESRVDGNVWHMAAAGGKLLVMTEDGVLHVFGPEETDSPVVYECETTPLEETNDRWEAVATMILSETAVETGYALVIGVDNGRLGEELLRRTDMHVIMMDRDEERISSLRERLDKAGLYGKRTALLTGEFAELGLPPYMANLIISERPEGAGFEDSVDFIENVFPSLRPYGGTAWIPVQNGEFDEVGRRIEAAGLENAAVRYCPAGLRVVREGALRGSGWWTHQNACAANTYTSPDRLVRAPLGLLWFGGPSHRRTMPRSGRPPTPHVAGGRTLILGLHTLEARDVYTGRELWVKDLPDIGGYYHHRHGQPGVDHIGAPYVSLKDSVYVAHRDNILKLNPETGRQNAAFYSGEFVRGEGEKPLDWGYIGVWEDLLIGTLDPIFVDDQRPGDRNWNAISSRHVVVMNRFSGEKLWSREAGIGFRHNAIVTEGGRMYIIDRLPEEMREKLKRRGELEEEPAPVLLCLDARTGEKIWEQKDNVFGTWLGVSEEHGVLLQGYRPAETRATRLPGEPRDRLSGFCPDEGDMLWDRQGISYENPPLIRGSHIIVDGRGFCLLTGENKESEHPITGETVRWNFADSRNCAQMIGSEHLLTFRRGTGAAFDLKNNSGTLSIGGFRAGCTPNMVAGDGVLSVPDMTRTCDCSYHFSTSLGLAHMDDVEGWSVGWAGRGSEPARKGGINFGAPGNRMADSVMWLSYPLARYSGGTSPRVPLASQGATSDGGDVVPVQVSTDHPEWTRFQSHPSLVQQGRVPWVSSSGLKGEVSIDIELLPEPEDGSEHSYDIKLYFMEPLENTQPGSRVFDVSLQDEVVLESFDIQEKVGGSRREIVKKIPGVKVVDVLRIELTSSDGSTLPPLLCGVEFLSVSTE